MFSHKQSDMPALDLSFLTPSEVAHIRQVLIESRISENFGSENTRRYISSDDVIEAQHKSENESFISSRDVVSTALPDSESFNEIGVIKENLPTTNEDATIEKNSGSQISSTDTSPKKTVEISDLVEMIMNGTENSENRDESYSGEMEIDENSSENHEIDQETGADADDEEIIERTDKLIVVPGKKQKKWWKKILTPKRKQKKNKDFDSENLEPIDETLVVYDDATSALGKSDTLERQSQKSETKQEVVVQQANAAPEDNTDVEALAAADAKSKSRVKLAMKDWVKTRTWPKSKPVGSDNTPSPVSIDNEYKTAIETQNMEKEPGDSVQSENDSVAISETPETTNGNQVEHLVEAVQPTAVNDSPKETVTDEAVVNEIKKQEETEIVIKGNDDNTDIEQKEDINATDMQEIEENSKEVVTVEEKSEENVQIEGKSSNGEANSNNKGDKLVEENPESHVVSPVIVKLKSEDEILIEMEERDSLAPLPGAQSDYDFTDDEGLSESGTDEISITSRTTTMTENSVVGSISIAMIYYEPSARKNTKCPSKGTKLNKTDKFDVMTRRNYVDLTKARFPILRGSSSGARPQDDGELHLLVREATDLKIPNAVMRNKSKTYVKCYLLPDKNHSSKMHSMRQRETNNPQYGHIFVFRGFNKDEFQSRCVEVLICGQTKRRGRGIRIGRIRLLANDQVLEHNISDNKEGMEVWNDAFDRPGQEVEATLSLTSTL